MGQLGGKIGRQVLANRNHFRFLTLVNLICEDEFFAGVFLPYQLSLVEDGGMYPATGGQHSL